MRGRKRKPSILKVMNGSAATHKDRVNTAEPKPPPGAPDKPDHVTGVAAEKWDEVVALLDSMGVLSRADADMLALYCNTYAGWLLAQENVSKTGQAWLDRKEEGRIDLKRNPYSAELHKYADRMARLLSEMGLTPSSRSRVNVNKVAGDPLMEMRERHFGSG